MALQVKCKRDGKQFYPSAKTLKLFGPNGPPEGWLCKDCQNDYKKDQVPQRRTNGYERRG